MNRAVVVSSGTKLYGGAVDHPRHGRVHVVGYSNGVYNTFGKPNCMIIHIPSADRMTKRNFINPVGTDGLLNSMSRAVFPPPPPRRIPFNEMVIGASLSDAPVVQHFKVGDYEVFLADEPEAIPGAFEQLAPEKRPEINESIFTWYKQNMPGWHIALFCFVRDVVDAKPVFYWYKPLEGHESILRLPAIDSHDGTAPKLGEDVNVNHELFVSWPGIDGASVHPSRLLSDAEREFMPTKVAGIKEYGRMPNGDFGIEIDARIKDNHIDPSAVRRLSLPGSPVRF